MIQGLGVRVCVLMLRVWSLMGLKMIGFQGLGFRALGFRAIKGFEGLGNRV